MNCALLRSALFAGGLFSLCLAIPPANAQQAASAAGPSADSTTTTFKTRSADAKTSDEKTGDAKQDADAGTANPAQGRPFRLRQEVDVPLAAASIRVAVRDANTDRIGAMEIKLP